MEELLTFIYYKVCGHLSDFLPRASLIDLQVLIKESFKIDQLCSSVQKIVESIQSNDHMYAALLGLLKELSFLASIDLPNKLSIDQEEFNSLASINLHDILSIDQDKLLVCVSQLLESLQEMICNQLTSIAKQELVIERNQVVSNLIEDIITAFKTLYCFPMSCPISIISQWKQLMQEIIERNLTTNKELCNRPNTLMTVLESNISFCGSLADLRTKLKWASKARSLKQYSMRYSALQEADKKQLSRVLIQQLLELDNEDNKDSQCLDTLCDWLAPVTMTPKCIRSVTERLKPKYDVFIQDQEPDPGQKLDKKTITFFPDKTNHNTWRLCIEQTLEDSKSISRQFKEIQDKEIEDILDHEIQNLKVHSRLPLSEEKKAKLLAKLHYASEEVTVQHTVWFGDQILINQTSTPFSLVAVDMTTGRYITSQNVDLIGEMREKFFEKEINKEDLSEKLKPNEKSEINEKFVVIAQFKYSSDVIKALECLSISVSDQQLSVLAQAEMVCIYKHPGKPPIIDSVSKCGERVEHNFSYIMKLIINHNTSCHFQGQNRANYEYVAEAVSQGKHYCSGCGQSISDDTNPFQPLTDLLNRYDKFYKSQQHIMDALNSAIQAALEQYPSTLFKEDILELVKAVRHNFIW